MERSLHRHVAPALAALLLASGPFACAGDSPIGLGGQTGDEDAKPDMPRPTVELEFPMASSADRACQFAETPTPVESLDDATAGGFSAAEVLRLVEGSFDEPLRFDPDPHDGYEFGEDLVFEPRSEDTLEIEVEYVGGELRYFDPAFGELAPGFPCRGRLDIEVQVTLRTPSGAFDESVDAVLMAQSPTEAEIVLRFHTSLVEAPSDPPTSPDDVSVAVVQPLAGTLTVTGMEDPEGDELAFLELRLAFSELGINGHIDGWMYGFGGGHLRLASQLATIGDVCEAGWGFPIESDASPITGDGEPSADSILALLNELGVEAVPDEGPRMPIELVFEYTPGTACGRPGDDTPLIFEATLSFEVRLGEATLEAHWPVELRVRTDETGTPERIRIDLADDADPSIETLESDWGVHGLDLDAYDSVEISFELTAELSAEPSTIAGDLILRGYVDMPGMPVALESGDALGHLGFESPTP